MTPWVAVVLEWLPTILLFLFITLLINGVLRGRPKNFPPGMMMLPVVGSLLSMPSGPSTETLRGLKAKYGNMASFSIFGTRVVLVSGVNLMKEVFSLRVTTGRPSMLITTGRNSVLTDGRCKEIGIFGTSGQAWQEQRRFLLHHLRDLGFGKSSYEPVISEETAELIHHLKKEEGRPVEMRRLFNRSVVNVIWGMVMGKRYPYTHDKLKKLLETFVQPADFNVLNPIHHIPFILDWLEYIPGLNKELKAIKEVTDFLKEELKGFLTNEELRSGDSFTALYLREIEKKENPGFNMDQLLGLIFDMFVAGMETTSSTLSVAINLVAKHPDVQRHLQEELDEVVGRDRLASLSDIDRLPYLQATILEVQRVFNLVKTSIPHETTEDCKLGGYDIPKGTWLLANLDDVHRSAEFWKNARIFDPQNFLHENGKLKKSDAFMAFGVGKRICAGEPLARMELFLFFSHLMQNFTFTLVNETVPFSESNPMFNNPSVYTASAKYRTP